MSAPLRGRQRGREGIAVVVALLLTVASAATARAQSRGGSGTDVHGVVHDSVAGRPLADALVQLVRAGAPGAFSRSASSDSLGRFAFGDVPAGRYHIGFMHEALDALGIEAPLRDVVVDGMRSTRVDLAIPSPARLLVAICGEQVMADSSGVLLGTVRSPHDGAAVPGATVTGAWLEVTIGAGGTRQRIPRLTATTGASGWFALCGVPRGLVTLVAAAGADSSGTIDVQVPASGVLVRDLVVGGGGSGRLRGRVVSADGGRPLGGAQVRVAGREPTTTDSTGAWTLSGIPLGTRMVDVRAIGHLPERRVADVTTASPAVEVVLSTFGSLLDTVRVTAARLTPLDREGFTGRSRGGGMGRFLSGDQIARRNAIQTSDLFRTFPGFRGDGITMRGSFSDGGGNFDVDCLPAVYVDGNHMRGIEAHELDALVAPEHIAGLEVYATGAPRPAQFDPGMSGCGSIVIWLKPLRERIRGR